MTPDLANPTPQEQTSDFPEENEEAVQRGDDLATTKDNSDTLPSRHTLELNEKTNETSLPTIKPPKSSQPKYHALHAYRYTTQILQKDAQFFEESLSDYRKKTKTNSNDRAKNILFDIPWLGKLQISKTTGSITIYTNKPQNIERLEKNIGKPLYKQLTNKLISNSIGIHIPTTQIKLGQTIKTDQTTPLGKATITVTLGLHRGYVDLHLHFKIPNPIPSPYPDEIVEKKASKRRVSDAEILRYAIKYGQVTPNDYAFFSLAPKSLYPRLSRMATKGLLYRVGGKGIVYMPVAPYANSTLDRNSKNME